MDLQLKRFGINLDVKSNIMFEKLQFSATNGTVGGTIVYCSFNIKLNGSKRDDIIVKSIILSY